MRRLENICITIGIMTYNQENYIEDTLKSIIDQTYNNIELLILDDHSSDGTIKRIRGLEQILKNRFVSCQFLFHEENTGNISINSNELLRHAHGEYFKILGGDDILLPDYCAAMSDVLTSNPEIGYVFSDMCLVDGRYRYGQEFDNKNTFMKISVPDKPDQLFGKLLYGNYLPTPSFLYKIEMLRKIGGFDEEFSIEDYPLFLKLSHIRISYKYIDRQYVLYRVTGRSLSGFSGEERALCVRKFENIADNIIRMIDKYYAHAERTQYLKRMGIIMENMTLLCCNLNIPEETTYLDDQAEKRGLPLSCSAYLRDDAKISVLTKWQNSYAKVCFKNFLEKNEIGTLAVYGFGTRGRRLVRFLKKSGVSVSYLIDQAGQKLSNKYRVYKPEESFPEVDVTIVSLYQVLDVQQRNMLINHGCKKLIDLEDIIFNEDTIQ